MVALCEYPISFSIDLLVFCSISFLIFFYLNVVLLLLSVFVEGKNEQENLYIFNKKIFPCNIYIYIYLFFFLQIKVLNIILKKLLNNATRDHHAWLN